MRREPTKFEYRRETSAYDKSDYRSKFYKGRWEKAWIKNRVQYAINDKIDLYESMWTKQNICQKDCLSFFLLIIIALNA